MSTQSDISGIKRGEDVVVTMTIAGVGTIAAWNFEFNLRDQKTNLVALTKTSGAGITITDAVNRVITIALADTDTEPLRSDTYLWDCWRSDAGSESCLGDGNMELQRSARNG